MRYLLKKLLSMFLTLLAVSFFVFAAFEMIPGDAATSLLGTNATKESVEALREEMGLNRPFLVRYLEWGWQCLQGNFGESYSYHIPVSDMILDKLPITLTMSVMAFVITVLVI